MAHPGLAHEERVKTLQIAKKNMPMKKKEKQWMKGVVGKHWGTVARGTGMLELESVYNYVGTSRLHMMWLFGPVLNSLVPNMH